MNQKDIFNLVKQLTGQANILTIPRLFVNLVGSLDGALLLSQLIYWSGKKDDGWFYKSYDEWKEEICLSKYEVSKNAKIMIEDGFLETKVQKAPSGAPTVYYRILISEFQKWIVKKLDDGKSKNFTIDSEETEQSYNKDARANHYTEITTKTTTEITEEGEEEAPPTDASLFKNHNKTRDGKVENGKFRLKQQREGLETVGFQEKSATYAGALPDGNADIREIDQMYIAMCNAYYWLNDPTGKRAHPASLDVVDSQFKRNLFKFIDKSEYTPVEVKKAWDYYLSCWNSKITQRHSPRVFMRNIITIIGMQQQGVPVSDLFKDWNQRKGSAIC